MITVRPYADTDRETLRALLASPSLAPHFDKFQGPAGLEHKFADPRFTRSGLRLAWWNDEPAGFGLAWLLPTSDALWMMMRVGVVERFRRRGIGRALAGAVLAYADAERGGSRLDVSASAWMPNDAGDALAAGLGFEHERWFWLMEHPRGEAREPAWPAGVEVRPFDRSEAMLRDYTDTYNDSFSRHFRHVHASLDTVRVLAADPTFRPDGLLMAYRDGACVGFCRNELHANRGEIATLGVIDAARNIGLGRALLRWGVQWLEANGDTPVTLLVDGDNENALGLYRSEGFTIARTRRIWRRVPAAP